MALNYIKSGHQASVVIPPAVVVNPGDFHIIGNQLGVALGGGVEGDEIAVSLAGVYDLPCEGIAFEVFEPLNFNITTLALYAGDPTPGDFANVAMAWEAGGGAIESCKAKLNTHFAILFTGP